MADRDIRLKAMINRLRENNFRITPQRSVILKILAASEGHPSATQIHEQLRGQFPTMSLATVYKTLNILKEMGEVLELGFGDGDNRYDGNMPFPHPHLICINCRQIIDPEVPEFRALAQHIATISGFQIVSHRLDFFGICPDCQSDESN